MNYQKLLQQQFYSAYDKKEWYVPIIDALYGLTEEQAGKKITGEDHSIKELVIHITYWMGWYLDKYKGTATVPADQSNEYTFTEACLGKTTFRWEELKEKLNNVLFLWQKELEVITDEKLLLLIPGSTKTWVELILSLIQHIVYHTGQIIYIRKILKNWDSSLGVS